MNDDLRELFHQRGGVYDRQNLGRIRAEEKMAAQRGTGVGAEYNPILGKPMVTDALGGTNSADWNIGGNIASGTPVQLMGRGFGIVADAKPSRPSGDALSTGNQADRTGSLPTGFSPGSGSSDDSDGEDAWIAGPDGSCTVGNYAKGKAPAGSFKSLEECRAAQDKEYSCVPGEGCKAVPKGTGRYKSLGECLAALVPANFTGGQCKGIPYIVNYVVTEAPPNTNVYNLQQTFIGPLISVAIERPPGDNRAYAVVRAYIGTPPSITQWVNAGGVSLIGATVSNVVVTRLDNQPDDCGNPPKVCGV